MAAKVFGKGTLLQAGDVSTATGFLTIPGCRDITFQGFQADDVEVTSHDTPGGFDDSIQGLKHWGAIQADFIWDPADTMHLQLFSDLVAGTQRYWQIVYPDAGTTTFQFKGYVKSGPPGNAPIKDVLTAKLDIKIIGDPAPTLA